MPADEGVGVWSHVCLCKSLLLECLRQGCFMSLKHPVWILLASVLMSTSSWSQFLRTLVFCI